MAVRCEAAAKPSTLSSVAIADLNTNATETKLRTIALRHRLGTDTDTARPTGDRCCVRIAVGDTTVDAVDAAIDRFLGRNSIFEPVEDTGTETIVFCAVQHDVDFALRAWIDVMQHPEVAEWTPSALHCGEEAAAWGAPPRRPPPSALLPPGHQTTNMTVLLLMLDHAPGTMLRRSLGRKATKQYRDSLLRARGYADYAKRGRPLLLSFQTMGWGGLWFNNAIKQWEALLRGRPVLWQRYFSKSNDRRFFRYAGGEHHGGMAGRKKGKNIMEVGMAVRPACPAEDWTCFLLPMAAPRTRNPNASADACYKQPQGTHAPANENVTQRNDYMDHWGMSYGGPIRKDWSKGKRDLGKFREVVETFLGRWGLSRGNSQLARDIFTVDDGRQWPCQTAASPSNERSADLAARFGRTLAIWLLRRWATRPRAWLRRAVATRVRAFQMTKPCAALHVRRGDSVTMGRRHHTPAEWLHAIVNGSSAMANLRTASDVGRRFGTLLVMSDEQGPLDELAGAFPDLPWRALSRVRHESKGHGHHRYGMHLPSNDARQELIDLHVEIQLAASCDLLVYKRGALARTFYLEGCSRRGWRRCGARAAVCEKCCGGPGSTTEKVARLHKYFAISWQRCWPKNLTEDCGKKNKSCNECTPAEHYGKPTLFSF